MSFHNNTNQGLLKWKGNIPVFNMYTAGIACENFFRKIKDEGKFTGIKCKKCSIVYIPPRIFCERCFSELNEYVNLPLTGKLTSFTVAHRDLDDKPAVEPVVIGAVQIDGASTNMIHYINGNPSKLKIGMKVKAVLKPKSNRTGSILDILGFTA